MSTDLVTICGATIGDSAGHLNRQFFDMEKFTAYPFHRIICDDGTIDEGQKQRQREVCALHNAEWMEVQRPPYGISYAWNALLDRVTTPWAFCVEDGLRPGWGWLETAVDAIEKIGMKKWRGHEVGMMGTSHFNDWHLSLANVLPTNLNVMNFLLRDTAETYSAFWGGAHWPNWNDGLWCWKRMWPEWRRTCLSPESDTWPKTPGPWNFVHLVRHGRLPDYDNPASSQAWLPHVGTNIDVDPKFLDPKVEIGFNENWPGRRHGHPAWWPGAFMLVNMEAWRKVGRFANGCTFFEGHLGIRMAQAGYLGLYLDFPPWLHFGGMGFIASGPQGKSPRHHELCDGDTPQDILYRDFGVNGPGHVDLYNLVYKTFPQDKQDAVRDELAQIDLYADPHWKEWM